jgi:CHAT domain-containing protein
LRTIPFAALQDGDTYLVQRIAVVTEPSVTLAGRYEEPATVHHEMLAGTDEAITYIPPPLPPLRSVDQELDFLHDIYPQADSLRNKDFTIERLQTALRHVPYNIVHIAAHAVFGDTPEQTYFYTHDGVFSLDTLQASLSLARLQNTPLDLLVLSACATADGNDATALGLAGVAVKAGARTAIGALWGVNGDVATRLMQRFYIYLADPARTKAQALRLAELDILQETLSRNPYAWAPFLIIGSGR